MAKLKLQPEPTFKAKVGIPVPGGAPVSVEFTFIWRNREDLQKFIAAGAEQPDTETILQMCSGWESTDPFTRESIDILVANYIPAPQAIFDTYIDEHTKARTKN